MKWWTTIVAYFAKATTREARPQAAPVAKRTHVGVERGSSLSKVLKLKKWEKVVG